MTNNFALPALTIALLYKARWKIELFFKVLKGNVRIEAYFGRDPKQSEYRSDGRSLYTRIL